MADIAFVNNTLIPGTTFNPGLEDVLDRNGTLSGETATGLTITNDSGGVFDGFRFELKGTNFAFTNGVPTAGTITSITVKAPTGTTQIIEVAAGAGGFGNTNLKTFFDNLKAPDGGVFDALDRLLDRSDVVTGSALADHLTVFGAGAHTLLGNGGNDVLSARSSATLIGGTGNDTIQVSEGRGYVVAGADLNGLGGAGERNTLEVRGESDDFVSVSFNSIHDIDALRFVDTKPPTGANVAAAELDVDFLTSQIGAGQVSLTLAVNGSSQSSPHSENDISIFRAFDPKDTSAVNLDLSGWTFTNWDQNHDRIFIHTNQAVALNDRIVGTSVADFIHTNAGNDTIRGGGGADNIDGGDGSDTFVYGRNEAARGEVVIASDFPRDPDIDKVIVLADNNFTGVGFIGIDQLVFGGKATATFSQSFINTGPDNIFQVSSGPSDIRVVGDGNANTLAFALQNRGDGAAGIDLSDVAFQSWSKTTDRVTITGTRSGNDISGSTENDIINGGGGRDSLQGNEGADAFVFKAGFGRGVAHVSDFTRGQDILQLDDAIFTELKLGGLKKKAFGYGTEATKKKQHIIFDKETGVVRYDDDGSGKHEARKVAVLDDVSNLKFDDILVI